MSVHRSPIVQSAQSPFPYLDIRLNEKMMSSPQMKNVQHSPVVDLTPQMRSRSASNITIELSSARKRSRELRSPEAPTQPSKQIKPGNKTGGEEGEINDEAFEEEDLKENVIDVNEEDVIVNDEQVEDTQTSKKDEDEMEEAKINEIEEEAEVESHEEVLMKIIQKAINSAIMPLHDEIKLLNNVIKDFATKNEIISLTNEMKKIVINGKAAELDFQSPGSFNKSNGNELPAGRKQKVLAQMTYSDIAKSNLQNINDIRGNNKT